MTFGISLALLVATPARGDTAAWSTVSEVGRDALLVAALGIPAAKGDWRGDLQAGSSLAAAEVASITLKALVHERRPDRSDDNSFPSGHTEVSFAAAATLEKRYGWSLGLPAFAVASVVGASRVGADKHYVHDVVAGAVIGTAAGWLITSKRNSRVQLVPWTAHRGGGLTLATPW